MCVTDTVLDTDGSGDAELLTVAVRVPVADTLPDTVTVEVAV